MNGGQFGYAAHRASCSQMSFGVSANPPDYFLSTIQIHPCGVYKVVPCLQLHEGCILREKPEEMKFPWISAYINSSYLERPWLCFAKRQGDLAG